MTATTKPPFIRNVEGSRVLYDVLASPGTYYYTVEMLGLVAISCECTGNHDFHRHCKHMTDAEKAERDYQDALKAAQKPISETEKRETAPLNGNRTFSLLR